MCINKEEYLKKESERIGNLFSTKKHGEGFSTKEIFVDWYIDKIKEQKFKCYYCETSIFNIEKLIISGKLKKRKIRYGYRGPVLEIDKKDNDKGYNKNNCALSCYYCNNDKSYITGSSEYKKFFGGNRKKYFKILLKSR